MRCELRLVDTAGLCRRVELTTWRQFHAAPPRTAIPLRALLQRNSKADWEQLDEVTLGCANQAGEDNRNVGRMALLLAGIPQTVPGSTVNRLCASGMEAIGNAARAIAAGGLGFAIAGGGEAVLRA